MKKIILYTLILSSFVSVFSCSDDFIDPQLEQNDEIDTTPITTLESLETFMNGTYALMRKDSYYYGRDFIVYGEVRGTDEMFTTGVSGRFLTPSNFTMISSDGYAEDTWRAIYRVISNANIVINANITSSATIMNPAELEEAVKSVKAQAYAIRALAYFDLIKLYGQKYTADKNLGVPLVLEVPADAEEFRPERATLDECYVQIESDFNYAINNIGESGSTVLGKRAVAGLMSRYYLYKEDYAKVYQYASMVTSSGSGPINLGLYGISWKIESLNSIFELAYGVSAQLGTTSLPYIYSNDGYGNTRLLPSFVASFEPGDIRASRKTKDNVYGMINEVAANQLFLEGKTPDVNGSSNYKMVRYEEIALNQAEAILMGGGGSSAEALTLVNGIRAERGVPALASLDMEALKVERGKELVGEGFRSWDLLRWNKSLTIKRTNGSDGETIYVGDARLAFPIPLAEENANPGIVQNRGYETK